MGWKTLKERFQIGHIVHVTDAGICIGSEWIGKLLVVGPDGVVMPGSSIGTTFNPELVRYVDEMTANPAAVLDAIATPDQFERSLPVWTYDGAAIIELQCEEYGWPNVTHDGRMMHDNTFFADRTACVREALENAQAGVRLLRERIAENEEKLAQLKADLEERERELATLTELAQ